MEQSQILPIGKLFESPLNPRRIYNEKKMEELIESVRAKGILMPLLVRPNNVRYEIATGHRRYRAAIALKLPELPVIVREMSDTDFLEILTIENLQREDLEPLDEAQGYRTLMEKTGYDVVSIATKVGKSESYIYQRLKLLELIAEAQKKLADGKITAGHAILIARLQPEEQKECLKAIEEDSFRDEIMSVRDLADFIERQIHLDLNSASFSKKDPDLVPEAGPCTTCPKRTGSAPALFPDIKKKDTCTDPGCFHKKIEAYTAIWIEKKSQDSDIPPLKLSGDSNYQRKKISENPEKAIPANLYTEITDRKKGSCEHAREGIIIEGRNQGKVLSVCMDPKCEIHAGRYGSYTPDPKEAARKKAEEIKRKISETIRTKILDEILKGASALTIEDERFIIANQFHSLWDEYRKQIFKRHGWEPKKLQYTKEYQIEKILADIDIKNLNRLSMEMALISCVRINPYIPDDKKAAAILYETAERYDVDMKAIENQVKAEAKVKKEKKSGLFNEVEKKRVKQNSLDKK